MRSISSNAYRFMYDLYVNHYLQVCYSWTRAFYGTNDYRMFVRTMTTPYGMRDLPNGHPATIPIFRQYLESPVGTESIWSCIPVSGSVLTEILPMQPIGVTTSERVATDFKQVLYLPENIAYDLVWNEFYPEEDDSEQYIYPNIFKL